MPSENIVSRSQHYKTSIIKIWGLENLLTGQVVSIQLCVGKEIFKNHVQASSHYKYTKTKFLKSIPMIFKIITRIPYFLKL